MRRLAFGQGHALVDRRAHQGVAEAQFAPLDVDQSCGDRRHQDGGVGPPAGDGLRRTGALGERDAVVERGDLQQRPGRRRQAGQPGGERPLQALGERQPGGQRRTVRGRIAGRPRKFRQGQGVARGLGEQARAQRGLQVRGVDAQQGVRRGGVQRRQRQLGQFGVVQPGVEPLAGSGQQHDRLRLQPAGDEAQDMGGGRVQPVRVLGDQQHRCAFGCLGDHVQHRQGDEEQVRCGPIGAAERRPQGFLLLRGDELDGRTDRIQQLLEPGVGQVCLALHPCGGQHAHARRGGVCGGVGQERGLPDAGRAPHRQGAAALVDIGDQAGEALGLRRSPEQYHSTPSGRFGAGSDHGNLSIVGERDGLPRPRPTPVPRRRSARTGVFPQYERP